MASARSDETDFLKCRCARVEHSSVTNGSLVLAGITIDISAEAVLLAICVFAAMTGAVLLYLRAVLTVLSNLRSERVHSAWSVALTVIGTVVFGGGLIAANRPVEPELVAALGDVVAESMIDDSMFNPEGLKGFDFERVSLRPFAKVSVDQADWSTELIATRGTSVGLAINELLEHEAERLDDLGWSVHRLVPNRSYAWESNFDGPSVVATNTDYVLSLRSSLRSYDYKISRRSCEGDVLTGLVEEKWREVDAFLMPAGSRQDALTEAESLVGYLPGARAAVVTGEYALSYGTNHLCAGSRVETGSLSVEGRRNAIAQIELRMQLDDWDVTTYAQGNRLQLVAERGDRVVVGYFSTTISSLDMVVIRGYPKACADSSFVSAGFQRV